MPIRHHIRRDLRLVVSIHYGAVSDQEFLDGYRTLFEDPEFDLGFNRLVDLRRTDSSSRSTSALRSFAAWVKQRYEGAQVAPKTAVVAPRDVSFGLARMYEAFTNLTPGEFVVFRSVDAALAWLGISDEMIAQVEAQEGLEVG
jgi:hypothetical protein